MEVFEQNPAVVKRQVERLNRVKADRDDTKVAVCLADLKKHAVEKKNIMDSLIAAVKAYATMGEIVGVLKEVYGEAEQPAWT